SANSMALRRMQMKACAIERRLAIAVGGMPAAVIPSAASDFKPVSLSRMRPGDRGALPGDVTLRQM
ncbi:MAG: hypothetical protein QNJ22_10280, partial [Desulfosarcinaceae bacterium]|nr:hypothetical protein [Desulfosarcinaceae bacterium]